MNETFVGGNRTTTFYQPNCHPPAGGTCEFLEVQQIIFKMASNNK